MTIDAVRAGYTVARVRARPRAPGHRADPRRLRCTAPASSLRLRSRVPGAAASLGADDPRDRPGDDRHHLPRLRPRGADRGPRLLASSSSTSRGPGWVEHDATEIWEVTRRVAARGDRRRRDRAAPTWTAIGITNQRETVVAWDPRDRRAGPPRARLAGPAHGGALRRAAARPATRSWCASAPGSSSTPTSRARRSSGCCETSRRPASAVFGTIDSWLAFKLTGRHVTDYSNASRTMLFDIRRLAWDAELCELLGVDPRALPEPVPVGRRSTATTAEFGGEVPVAGIAGDQQAALFGQACHAAGMAKNTYGTGSFVLLNTGHRGAGAGRGAADHGRLGPRASRPTTRWRRRSSSPARPSSGCATGSGSSTRRPRREELAASLEANDGVYFVPALTGLGSPHWDPYARGTIVGLTRGTGRAHLARAALEAIAYQTVDAVRAQEAAVGQAARAAEGRRRRGRQPLADAVPGRRAGRAGRGARDRRDDGARRRLPGRDRDRTSGTPARSTRCGARRPATSPRWPPTSARRCSRDWRRAVERARGWAGGRVTSARGRGVGSEGPANAGPPLRHMADIKPQVYKDPRPAEYFDAVPRARPHAASPDWVYDVARIILTPSVLCSSTGAGRSAPRTCPPTGPVILAPNHFSQMDHFFAAVYLRRKVRFMAKSQLFTQPGRSTTSSAHGGAFPIRRGHHDEEAFKTAYAILDRGGCLLHVRRRAGAREPAGSASRGRASAGSRSSRACRSSRSRSTARRACAGGESCDSRR